MRARVERAPAVAALVLFCGVPLVAHGQTSQPQSIPLQLLQQNTDSNWALGINVGINGGAPQLYLFDTGSSLFNAVYNQSWWPGFTPTNSPSTGNTPASTVAGGSAFKYCYGANPNSCTGYQGNIVQATTLNFYTPPTLGAVQTLAATLSASPGYQINAVYNHYDSGTATLVAGATSPPIRDTFYGTFGASDFADQQSANYHPGGVLGQTIVDNVTQGYVVSANGQTNPVTGSGNAPQQANGQNVMLAGIQQKVTTCSPCVTVGLTPQMLGQFAPINPGSSTNPTGLVPWATGAATYAFPNPYGGATGNNSSKEFGANYIVNLTNAQTASATRGLLDTGTLDLTLANSLNGGNTSSGTLTVLGATTSGTAVSGLTTTSMVLNTSSPITYNATVSTASTNTIGISFFLQNSVLFDLGNQAVGYTPFFVTDTNLTTTASGPLVVDGSNIPIGVAGVISGPGGVSVGSGGALQLSATNTYMGVTTIAGKSGSTPAGLLYVAGPGSIGSSSGIVNNGVLDISRAWAPVGIQALSGAGWVALGGQNLTINAANGTFSGTISDSFPVGNAALGDVPDLGSFPGTGGSVTIAGGVQTLSGTNTYTGLTTVSGGQLVLNGSVARDVFVGTAGALSGTGTIGRDLFNAGIVSPGTLSSPLTVQGSYTQAAGGVYYTVVNAAGQSSQLAVGGTANLQGGTVLVGATPGSYAPRTTYTILKATGGVTGAFSSAFSSSPFLVPSLSYDANDVYLTLQAGNFGIAAQTPTQAAVAAVLNASAATASGDFANVIGVLTSLSPAQVSAALTSLSGQNYAAFSSSMMQGARLFMDNFQSQAGGSSRGGGKVALAEACDIACDVTEPAKWGAWGGGVGGFGTVGAGAGTGTVTYNLGGFAAGLDRRLNENFLAGVAVGYTSGQQWVGGFSGTGMSNTYQAALYGEYTDGPVYVDGLAGYAYSANQMWRTIAIPGLAVRTAQASTGANQVFGQVEGGYRFALGTKGENTVAPFARLQAYTGTQNGFSETGAQSLNLSVASQTSNSLRSVLGAQVNGAVDLGWREKLGLQIRLGWSHEYASTSLPVSATLAGAAGQSFTTYGVSPQRDGMLLGFAVGTAIADATSLYARYEGIVSGQDNSHAFTAGVRMTW
ncbi:autotransporter outer membrane beta-barrel domain-containing protein [Enhydrobacter aerosaccus]|uniref:autotransporter outer membrane beta-barrel domain-containing protein n=1 Tax=Enhydrobacter aerosaccus TaxID=225324 RepID=UPI0014826818|nr:autotransporter outer membrane beta-barrel domain-containing protein [Enhydrobacter aerosaccus]